MSSTRRSASSESAASTPWPSRMAKPISPSASAAHGALFIARREAQPIQQTGHRWYRELIQGETTMFVGSIPPGRAPDHFHLYEEVLCILDGVGVMHKAGEESAPIARG